jgi:hypothetical protein
MGRVNRKQKAWVCYADSRIAGGGPMCHHVHVTLSAEEKNEAKKLAGILIPIYASIALAVFALVAVVSAPPQGELIASGATTAAR